jgi:magnesium transporter
MLKAYAQIQGLLTAGEDLSSAVWIDLLQPTEAAAVTALGVQVPTLEDMKKIQVSNRLYHDGGLD